MDSPATPPGSTALAVYRPLVEKVLAALGALVTHHVAYLIASLTGINSQASDHGHISIQWAIITPMAVAVMAAFVIWQLRDLGFRSTISVRSLAGLVIGFFLVQETIEGLVGGRSPIEVASHPAIITGVVVAPLVAWAISRFLTGVTELAARFLTDPPFGGPPRQAAVIPLTVRWASTHVSTPSRPRAPPSRFRT